jgi:hypothetical protein
MVSPVDWVEMCYVYSMNISDVVTLVQRLCNGIRTDEPINPEAHANLFQEKIEDMGGSFNHQNCQGYVVLDDDEILYVHWVEDGVDFGENQYHEDMMEVLRAAFNTINEIEECPNNDDDDSDEDMEWI